MFQDHAHNPLLLRGIKSLRHNYILPGRKRCGTTFRTLQTPTKKLIGYGTDRNGRRTRLYDPPQTPFDRLLAASVLSPAQEADLTAYRDALNPAELARRIGDLQDRLVLLVKDKTEQLHLASFPSALPDVHHGIRIQAS